MSSSSNMPAATVNRPMPRKRLSAFPFVLIAIAVFGCILPTAVNSPLLLTLLTSATINGILATAVGLLIRHSGLVSFGHAAFFGAAAYVMVLALERTGISVETVIIAAIVLPTICAFGLAFVMLRVSGVAFSMLTLAVAQACYELVMRWRELANGEDGLAVKLPNRVFGLAVGVFQRPDSMFLICWIILMIVLLGLWFLGRSHFGTLTLAIQDNEERARFIGYETTVPRAIIFALSAAVAATAGVLFSLYNGFVTPDTLHWTLSGDALIMAIIGGARSVWGPALGAVVFFFIRDAAGGYTEHWPALIGITLILVTVAMPTGLSGAFALVRTRFGGARNG
ncbi:MAG: branched-chain amino acid transporter permease [Rhodospirillales bacterium]|nr:branched-chain amino acid transporter permease [Rhodospirillales bacterium]